MAFANWCSVLRSLLVALVLLPLLVSRAAAAPEQVITHLGSVDPLVSGWGINPDDTSTVVSRTAVTGTGVGDDLSAWQIADGSTASGSRFRYQQIPSPQELSRAAELGWVVRAVVRLPTSSDAVDAAVIVELSDGVKRWAMVWGTNSSGDPIVQFFGDSTAHPLSGATFHSYELRYDPASDDVDLYADGVLLQANFPGIAAGAVAPRFDFGSGSSAGTGTAQYHRVEWLINGDADQDGIGDPFDRCPYLHDDNSDAGGVGTGSPPDGDGDACQCAELDGNGVVEASDLSLLRLALVEPGASLLSPEALARCSASQDPSECDLTTAARIARALAGLSPAIGQRCDAYTGFGQLCGDGVCTNEPGHCRLEPFGCQADCGPCLIGEFCAEDADCASGTCSANACAATAPESGVVKPGDGVCDPVEHCYQTGPFADPDSCGRCQPGDVCHITSDCIAGSCAYNGACTGRFCDDSDHFGSCECLDLFGLCIDPDEGATCRMASDGFCGFDGDCVPPDRQGWCIGSGAPGVSCSFVSERNQATGTNYIDFHPECSPFPVPDVCDGGICKRCGDFCNSHDDCDCGKCDISVCQDGSLADSFLTCAGGLGDTSCWCPPETSPGTDSRRCAGGECGTAFARLCGVGETCRFSSANCQPGLFCYVLTNECVPELPNGVPCSAGSQCASGVCNFGFCVAAALPEGSPCTTNIACQSGVCVGVCVGANCPNGSCESFSESCGTTASNACLADCGLCADTAPCSVNADCESGYCDPDATTGVGPRCGPCRDANAGLCANGESCDDDIDCAVNSCISGFCAPPPPLCSGSDRPDGCQCSSNGDCASNLCAAIPGEPDVCAPASCAGRLPGSACLSNADCCDFPGVNISCSFFICQP